MHWIWWHSCLDFCQFLLNEHTLILQCKEFCPSWCFFFSCSLRNMVSDDGLQRCRRCKREKWKKKQGNREREGTAVHLGSQSNFNPKVRRKMWHHSHKTFLFKKHQGVECLCLNRWNSVNFASYLICVSRFHFQSCLMNSFSQWTSISKKLKPETFPPPSNRAFLLNNIMEYLRVFKSWS